MNAELGFKIVVIAMVLGTIGAVGGFFSSLTTSATDDFYSLEEATSKEYTFSTAPSEPLWRVDLEWVDSLGVPHREKIDSVTYVNVRLYE